MIKKNLERTEENIKNIINKKDYNFLKKNASLMINEITKAEKDLTEPFTKRVNDLIVFFNKIFPDFLDVFINQTNDCIIEDVCYLKNEKLLALKESEFYTHILDGHFEIFLNTFETIYPLKWIVKSSFTNTIQVFDLQYFKSLKNYLYDIINSNDFYDFLNRSKDIFTEKSWYFASGYESLSDTDMSDEQRTSLKNWWLEYTQDHDTFMNRFKKDKSI